MSLEKLGSLSRKSTAVSEASNPSGARHWLASYGIPVGLLLGFLSLMAILFGERLLPARELALVNVMTLAEDPGAGRAVASVSATSEDAYSAPVLFQASGWIEPDPLPVKATALISGVVDEVFVLEGDKVGKDDIIASLVDDDAELDLATAKASRKVAKSRLASNKAEQDATQARIAAHKQRLNGAEALLVFRYEEAERFEGAGPDGVPQTAIIESRQKAVAQGSEIEAIQSEIAEAEAQLRRIASVREQILGEITLAETEVSRRTLALERTRIRSPIEGRVMRLFVQPGQQRMLGSDNKDSAAIAYLYDPEKLQARIDVPLSEAAQLNVGQAARIRSNFLPDTVFRGVVTRISGEADLQRNTLQVKVAIDSPDERLRPDMLCRAEFLSTAIGDAGAGISEWKEVTAVRVYVPESALMEKSNNVAEVWVLDQSNERVERRRVSLDLDERDGYIRAREGLRPGDRVVANPPADLRAGERVIAANTNL